MSCTYVVYIVSPLCIDAWNEIVHCKCTVHLVVQLQTTLHMSYALQNARGLYAVHQVHQPGSYRALHLQVAVSGCHAVYNFYQVHCRVIL